MVEIEHLHILLVEDSESARILAEICLQDGLDFAVTIDHATTLAAGLTKIEHTRIDLVLLDLTLPDSSGNDTFREWRQACEIPVVVLTGMLGQDIGVEAVRLGAEEFVSKETLTPETLGRAVRFAMERHWRRHAEKELEAAHEIQQSFYPANSPDIPGLSVAGRVWSAEAACGDYYDYISLSGDTLGIAVGDVTGHGMRAALTMVEVRAYLRVISRSYLQQNISVDPGEILDGINDLLVSGNSSNLISISGVP